MTVHFDVPRGDGPGGFWTECNIVVTLHDPFQRGAKMVWLDVRVWVDDGVPKARCTSHP